MFALRFLALLAFVATAFAFTTPARSNARTGSRIMMNEKSKSLPFLPQPPNIVGYVGDVGFDPLGFSNLMDVKWLREAELKHGRVAMLASLGFVAASVAPLPGDIHQISAVAAHDVFVKNGGLAQVFQTITILELVSLKATMEMMDGSGRAPGDFGFDPCGLWRGKSEKDRETMAMKELANGRLAMLAFSGMITQAVLTGKGFPFA
jgi:light-harvesting complex I chlorophyll a/b binding protein 1